MHYCDCLSARDNTLLQGTIYILRKHIFRIFGPPSPLRKHVFSTENKHKLAYSDPSPPTTAYVIYEWSLALIMHYLTVPDIWK